MKANTKWRALLLRSDLFKLEDKKLFDSTLDLENNIVSHILRIYGYVKIKNFAKAKRIVENLIKQDPKAFIFQNIGLDLPESEKKLIFSNLNKIFTYLEDNFIKDYFSILTIYFSYFVPKEFVQDFNDEHSIDYSKQSIRKMINSPLFGLRAPGAWMPILIKRVNAKEIKQYLAKVADAFEDDIRSILWIFEFYVDKNKKIRKSVTMNIVDLMKKEDFYSSELAYSLASNTSLIAQLGNSETNKSLPNFRVKRSRYKNFIKKKRYTALSIFNLLGLGDSDPRYNDFH
ncbi:hypothetical protein N9B72_01340 [Bacteriovoracaceae bacterium]|nr:hypothetical protein [Bacteriovoracaceae bacterium]